MNQSGLQHDLLDVAIRDSVAGQLVSRAAGVWSRAWPSSKLGVVMAAVTAAWQALTRAQRIRAVGLAGTLAMMVDRVMALAGRTDPLSAVLPVLVLVICAATALLAGPIARASEHVQR
jgi:hypothetical protein